MKKIVSLVLASVMLLSSASLVMAADFELKMQIDNPMMTVGGVEKEIDPGLGTTPLIRDSRTILPVRAVVEEMGGKVGWEASTRTVTLTLDETVLKLSIDSKTAYVNDEEHALDSAPVIINSRTMLPIRFVAEKFGYSVGWDAPTRTVSITKKEEVVEEKPEPPKKTLNMMYMIDGEMFMAILDDNALTQSIVEKLPIEAMNLDGGDPKYRTIMLMYSFDGTGLETTTEAKAGDVFVKGNIITLVAEDMTLDDDSYKIGRIVNVEGLREIFKTAKKVDLR